MLPAELNHEAEHPALDHSRGMLLAELNHQVELVQNGVAEKHLSFRERPPSRVPPQVKK